MSSSSLFKVFNTVYINGENLLNEREEGRIIEAYSEQDVGYADALRFHAVIVT